MVKTRNVRLTEGDVREDWTREALGHSMAWAGRDAAQHHYDRHARLLARQARTWTCPDCGETREVSAYHPPHDPCSCMERLAREAQEAVLRQHRPAAVAAHIERAGIPRRFAGATFENFRPRKGATAGVKVCRAYAAAFTLTTESGLLLQGPFGSGKTHLAVATLRECIDRVLVHGRFTTVTDLLARSRAGVKDGTAGEPVQGALAAEFLVLDDLGQDSLTEWGRSLLWELIDTRYRANRPTVFTTNASDVQLRERLGGAVLSRLYEMAVLVPLTAADYRVEVARARAA